MAGTGANTEARWFVEQIAADRMTVDAARELIAVPDAVRAIWAEASVADVELAIMLERAANFRQLVGERFEELLTQPVERVREVRRIHRSVRHGARLPVLPVVASVATETGRPCTI